MAFARIAPVLMTLATCLVCVAPVDGGFGLGPPRPSAIAMTADIVVIGKVIEIEPEAVEAIPHGYRPPAPKGAADKPRIPKVPYKIAVLKIEEPLIGAKGLTRLRVGYADGPAAAKVAPAARAGNIGLSAGDEGCYFLTRHSSGEFYIPQQGYGVAPLLKSRTDYDAELARVKVVVKAINDPVSALKAKVVDDRFIAAQTILTRNARLVPKHDAAGQPVTEDLPAEENKLILDLLLELPWAPKGGPPGNLSYAPPSRSVLWPLVGADKFGFQAPKERRARPGQSPPDVAKQWEDATTAFLKDNRDKIKLQKPVAAK
jgi:hypothetical protein